MTTFDDDLLSEEDLIILKMTTKEMRMSMKVVLTMNRSRKF